VNRTPSEVGGRAELAIAAALRLAGKRVYLPFFASDSRVDLVYEDDDGFHRAQCKTSRLLGDVISFCTCSNTKNVRKDYRDDVDVFGVYSPERDEVFLVPVSDVPARAGYLRLRPTRNGQQKGIRWARDYLLASPPEQN
jgi:hypothetical protein